MKLEHRGTKRSIPVLPVDVLPMMLCETGERDVRSAIADLASDEPASREQATTILRAAALRHEPLLRSALEAARDAEVRLRLAEIVGEIEGWKESARLVRERKDLLRAYRGSLRADGAEAKVIDAFLAR